MNPILPDQNIAIIAADGFDEHQMTEIQRALVKATARVKIVAPENGIVNGWQGDIWGHHFHVDSPIHETLGSDFNMLVLPGGTRSIEKLKANPHTRRILNHFLDAKKPIAAIGGGVALLALGDKVTGRTVAASIEIQDELKKAGIEIGTDEPEIDGNILTSTGEDLSAWVAATLEFFADAELVKRAA